MLASRPARAGKRSRFQHALWGGWIVPKPMCFSRPAPAQRIKFTNALRTAVPLCSRALRRNSRSARDYPSTVMLGQTQGSPDRIGKGAGHAHGIILLQEGDGVADLRGKNAVDRAAVVAEPAQLTLHRTNIRRLRYHLLRCFEIIKPARRIPLREIDGVYFAGMMQQAPFVSRGERIN